MVSKSRSLPHLIFIGPRFFAWMACGFISRVPMLFLEIANAVPPSATKRAMIARMVAGDGMRRRVLMLSSWR
ncbi:MAG: hypothetical protein BGO23_12095 [Solirubrobacterales bacterium 67-14]|nr:MAG: hypothetical protein BGO23_12095 [Solirubrobacterales bacterium 67-14]